MTFEEFISKKDEHIEESRRLIEYLTQEYNEDYLILNNKINSDEILKAIEIECKILIALLQEKQDILSKLRYDNYEMTIKAFEEKEEQIYRQFCILRSAVYKKSVKKLKPQRKSREIFDNIKYRQKSKSFMETLNQCKCWIINHYNMTLTLSLIIGAFISIAYFFRISYFPQFRYSKRFLLSYYNYYCWKLFHWFFVFSLYSPYLS